jgi:2'-5' RNA ligase
MRTFIAIPLPPDSQSLLSKMQQKLRETGADVRWTPIPSIHLTLKFLGEVDPALPARLAGLLRSACGGHAQFSLTLAGLGAFPGLRDPRVVWCGIRGDTESLISLQLEIDRICAGLGFEPESREFRPHLTLGRVKGSKNVHRLAECIKIGSELESDFVVRSLNMYRSTLTPGGAIYGVLEEIALQP